MLMCSPLYYEFLYCDPDVLEFMHESRSDYVVAGIGRALTSYDTAVLLVIWLQDIIENHDRAWRDGGKDLLPDVIRRLARRPCGGPDKPRAPRCGDCLRCSMILTPLDGLAAEAFLCSRTEVFPQVVVESLLPGQSSVTLWGLITMTWTWEALVAVRKSKEIADMGDQSEYFWRIALRYLSEKSPLATSQALKDGASPPGVPITRKDFLPFFTHEDRTVREAAICAMGQIMRN